jgi:cell division protein FtsI (penicillin-binding protein 3)
VLGLTDVDGQRIAGVEKLFDERCAREDEPLRLSIDLRVQAIVREELTAAVNEFKAPGRHRAGARRRTGETLAMVSLPDFDPNQPHPAGRGRVNRATKGVYEMARPSSCHRRHGLDAAAGTVTLGGATTPASRSTCPLHDQDYHG